MLVLEVFRYLKRRADKRPLRLSNFVSMEDDHGQRSFMPKVSIIIPTRDKYELLHACIEAIRTKTTYRNYEIVVINNASSEASTIEYLEILSSSGVRVLDYPYEFNYSKISNFGAANTNSDYLCFLNNDTEVIEPNWLGHLMDHGVKPNVGIVGSKLMYPSGTIQHLGIALGFTGAAGHVYRGEAELENILSHLSNSCFEVSAVTFACALVRSTVFESLRGLDPLFKVGLNDVDFAMRCRRAGLEIVVCSKSNLIHSESQSRGPLNKFFPGLRAVREVFRFIQLYGTTIRSDPYFRRTNDK